MRIEQNDLKEAVDKGLITKEQGEKLWTFWEEQLHDVPSFRFAHILYYLGGLIAISAMTLFVTQAWEKLQGYPLLTLALIFFILGIILLHYFFKKELCIPAGIMATFSIALVPLIVYNIQYLLGNLPYPNIHYGEFHEQINWYWTTMEISTLVVGIILFYFYRLPFLLFPISFVLWYMSMDLWPLIVRLHEISNYYHATFSMIFGLFMIVIAIIVDFNNDNLHKDYAFWLYIFGVMTFWGGLSCQHSDSELGKFIYCLINIAMLFISVILNRRVFAIFGAIGILIYLGHLAFSVFANSLGFPIVLVLLGIIVIFFAAYFTRIEHKFNKMMQPYIPKKILQRMNGS